MITTNTWEEALIQLIEISKSGRERNPCYNDDYEKEGDGEYPLILIDDKGGPVDPYHAWDASDYFRYGWNELIERKILELELSIEDGLKTLYLKTLELKLSELEGKFLERVYYSRWDLERELFKRVVEKERLRLEIEEIDRVQALNPREASSPFAFSEFEKMLE